MLIIRYLRIWKNFGHKLVTKSSRAMGRFGHIVTGTYICACDYVTNAP